ncbi:gamma-carotene 1'-hydroxylase CruF [Iningainema tapete]|uniref:Carotenoid biosynthesis protein n=1 Tax=Iningainema tapete BLCC-T55 TaxID=2748662 RepID=A0A8J6XU23_9CYAN|nr:carotenoid biosynthesis protein [Iningainema tapete]MBD2778270.1 carotenoid biosynthesis protein [Iningainema tapete BLCC-T55]
MRQLVITERICLFGHILAKAFGLVGILLVIPNAELILNLGSVGQTAMQMSMADGGVVDIILGTIAVSIYAYRTLGWRTWLGFMLPAVSISVGSELLGTSIGFPFGDYSYLSGLGYKIAGLVPFTIPLSWFYVGLSAYLIARAGLKVAEKPSLWRQLGAIFFGAMLFTCWDFALEPAMSQTSLPFWFWKEPGAFFGTPYRNYAGWFGTSALFMSVAALLWRNTSIKLERSQLNLPIIVYLSNFAFAAGLSLGSGFIIPVSLGLVFGVIPAVVLWSKTTPTLKEVAVTTANEVSVTSVKVSVN